jgi:DNA-binding NtrC family response regulator
MSQRFPILLVDDDAKLLHAMHAILSSDFEVVSTESAEEALLVVAKKQFHVVCTDFHLPQMNGLQLLDRLRHMPYPFGSILLTGSEDYRRYEQRTHHYVLLKPYDPERLINLVSQLAKLAEMKRSVVSLNATTSVRSR